MSTHDARVILEPVNRDNFRSLFQMVLKPGQESFVTPARWTLARCYVRMYGDNFEHLPHLLRAGDKIVGYVTTVCDPQTRDNYWIDDIMIAADHQGRGYGRGAMVETIRMITRRYANCRAIRLTCFRDNTNAAALYKRLGFTVTGDVDPEFGEPNYILETPAIDRFRNV